MNPFIIAAAAAAMTLSTPNRPAVSYEDNIAHIQYVDLDLSTYSGRPELNARLRRAARRICSDNDNGPLTFSRRNPCYRPALSDGLNQMTSIVAAIPANASTIQLFVLG